MKKNHYMDYAKAAFRLYAQVGGAETFKQKIWNEAILAQERQEGKSGLSKPSEAAIIRAERAVEEAKATIWDLEAVERTLSQLEVKGRELVRAVQIVYMAEPHREPKRGELQDRTHRAELLIPASEKTIYRWLALARLIFAKERGLRVE